ncbi:uncharacterized protein LOC6575855 isoform X2 [Drosophila mojavensis]|uniref:Uncharacterized protein, isoform B n=1 Tax=Drosophila mojavensis TaxID=7230 RepID=A0A0Q9XG73_DROMO|nr:uncharacterized protein LOC6575855 isoform X2 [Drosophila mojavensis]KRG02632.1 uncharacterized protein Dmoj_GI17074, isoform B [Drosophila mojavensis]
MLRKSLDHCPTGVLSYKMPRLETDAIMEQTNNNPQTLNPCQPLEQEMEQLELPPPIVITPQKPKTKSKRKNRVIKDQIIKLSRDALLRDREIFFRRLTKGKWRKPKIIKHNNTCEVLLNSFRQSQLFPDRLKRDVQLNSEQAEAACESTLRAILGAEYSDELSREILSMRPLSPQLLNTLEISALPPLEAEQPIQLSPPAIEDPRCNNNNNNSYTTYNDDIKNIDSLRIMMHLLSIWRYNPDLKCIDANKFIKSFPDRFKAALAFNHLLYLAKEGFIELSTKPDSVEINEITLGAESNWLIEENLTTCEQFINN